MLTLTLFVCSGGYGIRRSMLLLYDKSGNKVLKSTLSTLFIGVIREMMVFGEEIQTTLMMFVIYYKSPLQDRRSYCHELIKI